LKSNIGGANNIGHFLSVIIVKFEFAYRRYLKGQILVDIFSVTVIKLIPATPDTEIL